MSAATLPVSRSWSSVLVLHPDVRERVVVDAHAAAQPAIGVVLLAQARERPCRAHPLEGGVQPQRDEDGGVDGRPAGMALDRPDALVQR